MQLVPLLSNIFLAVVLKVTCDEFGRDKGDGGYGQGQEESDRGKRGRPLNWRRQ